MTATNDWELEVSGRFVNGQIVLDRQLELPEGTRLRLYIKVIKETRLVDESGPPLVIDNDG